MFGGSLMKTLDRHPDRVNYTSGYASAAAGAYQFMPATWRIAVRALDLVGFGPHAQDQAALYLIQKRGAMGLADRGVLTPQLAAKLAPEWASFPTLRGYSYYGQPVVKYGRLKRFYDANLQKLRRMHPAVALVEEPQVIELLLSPATTTAWSACSPRSARAFDLGVIARLAVATGEVLGQEVGGHAAANKSKDVAG